MKRIFTFISMVMLTLVSHAQTNPNRVLVRESSGNIKGFLAERIDSIYFDKITGRVAADVEFKSYDDSGDTPVINVSVTKTANCQAFRIAFLSTNLANQLTSDAQVASYLEAYGSQILYDNFTNGQLSDPSATFTANTSYTVLTIGYDKYGIACASSRAEFTTPKATLVGNPQVTYTIDEVGTDNFTLTFTPNSDVEGYAFCCFKKGQLQQQFEQMGAFFGYASIGDMVKGWGVSSSEAQTYTYNYMDPGVEYEVAIQAWDVNENYADIVLAPVTTKALGGEGKSVITITIGETKTQEGVFTQRVTFTPNDQTNLYRDMLVTKEAFDQSGESTYVDYLKQDMDMVGWNHYGVDDDYWTLNPSTEYYALAIGQNANGEWGELAKVAFTTPATAASAPAADQKQPKRIVKTAKEQKGLAPVLKTIKGIQLIEK